MFRKTQIISTKKVIHDTINHWTQYLELHVLFVFIKNQNWKNTSVYFLQFFSEWNHCCTTKGISKLISTFSLNDLYYSIHDLTYIQLEIDNIFIFSFLFITILFTICGRCRQWFALNRYCNGIDWENTHF